MILITGGAGFIGSHLTDELINRGLDVAVIDSLDKQVHSGEPDYLNPKAEYIFCDILDTNKYIDRLLKADCVFHFASRVGVGQSQYEIESYTKTNIYGTAKLLQNFIDHNKFPNKFIIAASMSSYGEGAYKCSKCGTVRPKLRAKANKQHWDPLCPGCSNEITPIPTSEEIPFQSNSIYALTKQVQEEMVLNWGISYKVPVVSLRFFNVYGTRQTLNNPYTGAAAIFINRILNNKQPYIFEDGKQSRSFISVKDIVQACILSMEKKEAENQIFNVGTEEAISIHDLAKKLIGISGKNIEPHISGEFRIGDIRHCFSDISKIKEQLGFKPASTLDEGLKELYEYYKKQEIMDIFDESYRKLKEKKLVD